MDINNVESSKQQNQQQHEKAQEEKKNLDKEDKEFLQLLKGTKRTNAKSQRAIF